MTVIRWIAFIPGFLLYIFFAQIICAITLEWMYLKIVEIDSLWDYVVAGVMLSLLGVLAGLHSIGTLFSIGICPQRKLGFYTDLMVFILMIGFFWYPVLFLKEEFVGFNWPVIVYQVYTLLVMLWWGFGKISN